MPCRPANACSWRSKWARQDDALPKPPSKLVRERSEQTVTAPDLDRARDLAALIREVGVEPLLIGACAMAAAGYVRGTEDIDLAVNLQIQDLKVLAERINAAGWEVKLNLPDGQDPLGGVISVNAAGTLVQVINFGTTFPAVIRDALADPRAALGAPGLMTAGIPYLITLKLYAGGMKSDADIEALLSLDAANLAEETEQLCRRYRLMRELRGFQRRQAAWKRR
jgi:hypothetical protein